MSALPQIHIASSSGEVSLLAVPEGIRTGMGVSEGSRTNTDASDIDRFAGGLWARLIPHAGEDREEVRNFRMLRPEER